MPQPDTKCGPTHHYACACREAKFERMEGLLREVLDLEFEVLDNSPERRDATDLRKRIEKELRQ